jgi:hypothetical protein
MPAGQHFENIIIGGALFSGWGLLFFPMGILGAFVWSDRFFDDLEGPMIAAVVGWMAYLTVAGLGLWRPSWRLLYVLLGLVVVNIAGCQCDHVLNSFTWSP